MQLEETSLPGAFVVTPNRVQDSRGSFGRLYDDEIFRQQGLDPAVSQCNYSHNTAAGTLRGMHFQQAPWGEGKLVRCTRGSVYDVIVDLRVDSPTHLQWFGLELTADNRLAMFAPAGCAHGFITLEDDTELHYQMTAPYHPDSSAGVRWNDPAFGITWPREPAVISDRDAEYALRQP